MLLLTGTSVAQNVTTWHNDINRTGWQQNENILTPSALTNPTCAASGCFGLLWQYKNLSGAIYSQPLVYSVSSVANCGTNPCIEVIVATERDILYAFDANSSSSTALGSLNLAAQVGGTWLNCMATPAPPTNEICSMGVIYPDIGVTSTPVIDPNTNTLYVVSLVVQGNVINYYLHAVNIVTQSDPNPVAISGSVYGYAPTAACGTGNGTG